MTATSANTTGSTPAVTPPATSPAPLKSAKPATAATAKTSPKTAPKKAPAAKPPAKATPPAAARQTKPKKPKLMRDSFTIPKDEYAVVEMLKQRAAALAQPVKKSELLRAGLKLLAGMSDHALGSALQAVPSIKTGRPKADPPKTTPTPRAKPSTSTPRK